MGAQELFGLTSLVPPSWDIKGFILKPSPPYKKATFFF
jgi:hypothetical protein